MGSPGAASGSNVEQTLRTVPFNLLQLSSPFRKQEGPGRYDAAAWEALDRVLDLARAHGLKVIISLLDNWKYNGAPPGAWGCKSQIPLVCACAAQGSSSEVCRALHSDSAKSPCDPDVCGASESSTLGAMTPSILPAAGGVDQLLDWSKTAPPRTQTHPGDKEGDFDDKVRGCAPPPSILV